MEKWVEIRKGGDFVKMAKGLGVSPVLARLMVNRGVLPDEMESYLYAGVENLNDPYLLKDSRKAALLLIDAIKNSKKIRVIGDYDIDGVCASYILEKAIKRVYSYLAKRDMENVPVDTCLPHRIIDGYGMNIKLVDEAYNDGVDLIITCDNGISALKEIEYGKEKGLTIIVTDHHEVPYHGDGDEKEYELVMADAIVNPKQPDCDYPFRDICGAVVAYKLSQILYMESGFDGDCQEFLDIAALATVGDVMPLCGENRIIVKEGLSKLKTTDNTGLLALINECDIDSNAKISAYHVGFVLGPCLNAAGRLDSAEKSLNLLRENDENVARVLARELRIINEERKLMTESEAKRAYEIIEELDDIPDIIVVYLPECHESLAGIIAGRIRERFNHPAIVLTKTEDGIKGSGRSIEAYDMHAGLLAVRELFSKFGGHKMAAGMSLLAENDEARCEAAKRLAKALNDNSTLKADDFCEKVEIDMELPFSFINERLVKELSMLEPFGANNRTPLFAAKHVKVNNMRLMGSNMDMVRGYASDETNTSIAMVAFRDGNRLRELVNEKGELLITFYPGINEYRGDRNLQLNIKNFR